MSKGDSENEMYLSCDLLQAACSIIGLPRKNVTITNDVRFLTEGLRKTLAAADLGLPTCFLQLTVIEVWNDYSEKISKIEDSPTV